MSAVPSAQDGSMPPSEAQVQALVHGFYLRVRADDVLGPIFNQAITDWDRHLETMCAFWSSVMRRSGRYHGNPMAAHLRLDRVQPEHFARWLALFGETAREQFSAELAELFVHRAENIARSLKLGMFWRPPPAAPAARTRP